CVEIQLMRTVRKRWTWLFDHVGTLVLSIIMGLIVWLIAINQENPLVVREFPERVALRVRGLTETLQPTQDLSTESVRLTLRAPQTAWDRLEASDLNAYVDLTNLGPGVHDVLVQVDVANRQVVVIEVQRQQLRIQLDPVITKTVPVRVDVLDSVAFGFDSLPPITTPSTVTVRGPASMVEQVSSATTQINLRSARNAVESQQSVELLDANRQPVARVEAEPSQVNVMVPVERWPFRKEVAVRVNLVGQPAPGYRLSEVKLDPATVVLRGEQAILDQVPGFVETSPLTLDGAKANIRRPLDLILPDGVTAVEGTTVAVLAGISPVESGRTVRLKPVLRNLTLGLKATVALDTVDVIIAGPLTMLESLGADDMFVIVNLAALPAGTHTITPTVALPPGIRAEGIIPAKVEVIISELPTPPPPGTLPPLATPTPVADSPLSVAPGKK
ncbi:MAG: CdaR family protein, partial [Chloroflexota bacterium]|nr:CdaR family protein [Chloroflexota bacterium]